jgi:hypothetical protein
MADRRPIEAMPLVFRLCARSRPEPDDTATRNPWRSRERISANAGCNQTEQRRRSASMKRPFRQPDAAAASVLSARARQYH